MGIIVMVDLGVDPVKELDVILAELVRSQVSPEKLESNVGISKTRSGGAQLLTAGRLLGCTREEITSLLKNYGISNAIVRTAGDVTLDNIEDVILETNLVYKPTVVIANKADLPHALERYRQLLDIVGSKMHVLAVSSHTGFGLSSIGRELFETLDLIRAYTREPNATRPSPDPFIMRKGSTVGELTHKIHSARFNDFKYARIWGRSVSYGGERVGIGHILSDRDVVEIHA